MIAAIIIFALLCIYLFAMLKGYKKQEHISAIVLWVVLVIYWTWQAIIDPSWWTKITTGLYYFAAVLFLRYNFGKLKNISTNLTK